MCIRDRYIYTKRAKIQDEESLLHLNKTIEQNGISSVTHFTPIHLSCHNAAVKADKALKKPKTEWEGAEIRNSHTKCNNWLPLRGPKTSDSDYENSLVKFFTCLESTGQLSQERLWVIFNDLRNLLTKIAKQENLSKDTKGGTIEHNIKLIPLIMQLTLHFFKKPANKEKSVIYASSLENLLEKLKKKDIRNITPEILYTLLTLALFAMDTDKWFKEAKYLIFTTLMKLAGASYRAEIKKAQVQKGSKQQPFIVSPVLEPEKEDKEPTSFLLNEEQKQNDQSNEFNVIAQPHMIFVWLIESIFNKISGSKAQTPVINIQEVLETFLTKNNEKLLNDFEEIGSSFKNEIVKKKSVEDFVAILNLKDSINLEYGSIENFINELLLPKQF
eukprot:TRINITY_DN1829_c0_g1_i14.p1 TRINITY_DN1829_c0_g1~~TRINITY_DN1829_c0_g1_i14.p1  ORF type:complete len:408 (-),score=78.39 TRINITY_DN1829_c0_g1_i14:144-1304(-)